MTTHTIFWLDEEENAAYPEMVQIRFHGVEIDYMKNVVSALDRIISSSFDPDSYSAFVIDAHMPTFGDSRFEKSNLLDRNLAGMRLCDILVNQYEPIWQKLRGKTLIYTMLPQSPRVEAVQKFAKENGAGFFHKSEDDQLYEHLKNLGWI